MLEKAQVAPEDEKYVLYWEAESLFKSADIFDSKEKAKLCRKKTGRQWEDELMPDSLLLEE